MENMRMSDQNDLTATATDSYEDLWRTLGAAMRLMQDVRDQLVARGYDEMSEDERKALDGPPKKYDEMTMADLERAITASGDPSGVP